MGTKNAPGRFDCYSRAQPDEPMFVLLGRDPLAPMLIQLWAKLRADLDEDPAKVEEARQCAEAAIAYLAKLGKKPIALELVGFDIERSFAVAAG